jgi:ABC-type transport system involved in multi-copper enzyme maturation permease subunit
MAYLLSLGLSSVTGSQPITVAVMLALNMFVMPVLAVINTLPSVRQLLPGIALYQLQPQGTRQFSSPSLIMSTTMIAVVLIGWAALAVSAGIWRTTSRDA